MFKHLLKIILLLVCILSISIGMIFFIDQNRFVINNGIILLIGSAGMAILFYFLHRVFMKKAHNQAINTVMKGFTEAGVTLEAVKKPSLEQLLNEVKAHAGNGTHGLNEEAVNIMDMYAKIADSFEVLAAGSEEMEATMNDMLDGALLQADNVEKSTKSMEEMSTGVHQVADNTERVSESAILASNKTAEGNKAIHHLVQQMQSIHSSVNQSADILKQLGSYSNKIGDIVAVITNISEQTNLLALNAAIEAARAGEHGKGFSVVAEEVRKLASESTSSAKEIAEMIQFIQTNTFNAIETMEKGLAEINTGLDEVNVAGDSFEHISSSISDVTVQIQEISATIQQIAAGTEEVKQNTDFTKKVQEGGVEKIRHAVHLSNQQKNNVDEIFLILKDVQQEQARLRELLAKSI
ncbi:methyl-accepting chemotaxis protein [Falsibacillus albus]|nr:methyl-accepting chemotaxis protein [Falsibacillus albus]